MRSNTAGVISCLKRCVFLWNRPAAAAHIGTNAHEYVRSDRAAGARRGRTKRMWATLSARGRTVRTPDAGATASQAAGCGSDDAVSHGRCAGDASDTTRRCGVAGTVDDDGTGTPHVGCAGVGGMSPSARVAGVRAGSPRAARTCGVSAGSAGATCVDVTVLRCVGLCGGRPSASSSPPMSGASSSCCTALRGSCNGGR